MKKQYILCGLAAALSISLSSCESMSFSDIWSNDYGMDDYDSTLTQPPKKTDPTAGETKKRATVTQNQTQTVSKTGVVVPKSYYLADGAPKSHQEGDQDWIAGQDSSEYTIQLADAPKASTVAAVLQKAPKNERMAQVQYDEHGQPMSIGVYGTYPTKADAEAALEKLPPDVRETAKVKSWNSVQKKAESSVSSSQSSIAPPNNHHMGTDEQMAHTPAINNAQAETPPPLHSDPRTQSLPLQSQQ